MRLRVGVDTGGTFTDICAYDELRHELHVHKVSSTPDDPGQAIATGIAELLGRLGVPSFDAISYFAHGTTVATNALLTERGVATAIITTRGFRDLLELGRGARPKLYDLQADKPHPLVPRSLRMEVTERIRHDGRVETPLDETEVRRAAKLLRATAVQAIAVCLLYSYVEPKHELRIREILEEELPGVYVSLSCEVLPEFREYERLSTVVTNAYIGPVMARYLSALNERLRSEGLIAPLHVTQSNGGVIPLESAIVRPVRTVLSGPSTGVVGAASIAGAAGFEDIITFDVGGTSSDVSLVQNASPKVATGMQIGGRHVQAPMLDIHTIGAGGGSIAWLDPGGHLKVGPASAGADPGPACYGRSIEATVTDANVVLQILNPEYLLDGQLKIDSSASIRAVGRLADELGLSLDEAADGIIRVVVANMTRAIRLISVQRGYDPRGYTLVPFGGGGPLFASRLARDLGIQTILIPQTPGLQSALGILMTDIRADFSATRLIELTREAGSALNDVWNALMHQASEWIAAEGLDADSRHIVRTIEMRYAGQNYELPVPVGDGDIGPTQMQALIEQFYVEHDRLYGYYSEEDPVQAVTFRLQVVCDVPRATIEATSGVVKPGLSADAGSTEDALVGGRAVYLATVGDRVETPVYHRSKLRAGHIIEGPAVIEQFDTTTFLLPGDRLRVDALGNLVVTVPLVDEATADDAAGGLSAGGVNGHTSPLPA